MSENQEPNVNIEKDIRHLRKLLHCLIIIFMCFIYTIWLKVLLSL